MDENNTQNNQPEEQVTVEVESLEVETADTATGSADNTGTVMLSLEGLIKNNLTGIGKLQDDLKKQLEMVNNVLASDELYQKHDEAAKEAIKVRTATKSEIMKRPDVAHVVSQIREMREEHKEQQQTLSDLLQEYQRVSGNTEIETEDGQMLQIVNSAKLVRK